MTVTRGSTEEARGSVQPVLRAARGPAVAAWVLGVLALVYLADLVRAAATNDRLSWDIVGEYLFDPRILHGLLVTLQLASVCLVVSVLVGLPLALMRMSGNRLLAALSTFYGIVFRAVPLVVQLLFWYFLGAVFPQIGLGVPFGPEVLVLESNQVISQFGAAVLGLALHEAAYMSEVFRGGLLAVPHGQREAAESLGAARLVTLRRVILPQAVRVIIPVMGSQLILLVKATSLVLVIGMPELLTTAQEIYTQNFQQIPLLIVVSFWYLVVVSALSGLQQLSERHFGRGFRR